MLYVVLTMPTLNKVYLLFIYLLCAKVCQWLATGRWFYPGTPDPSTNKADRHNIAEILLKVALKHSSKT
jgi:hypothetical protein